MDGFLVSTIENVVRDVDIFATGTGNENVLL